MSTQNTLTIDPQATTKARKLAERRKATQEKKDAKEQARLKAVAKKAIEKNAAKPKPTAKSKPKATAKTAAPKAKSKAQIEAEKIIRANKRAESPYYKNVIEVNRAIKESMSTQAKTLGFALKLCTEHGQKAMTATQKKIVKAAKQTENYKFLETLVKTSPSGNYSTWKVLQCIHSNAETILAQFAINASTSKTPAVKKAA